MKEDPASQISPPTSSWRRILLGGILAGVVLLAGELLLNGVILGEDWEAVLTELHAGSVPPLGGLIFALATILLGIGLTFLIFIFMQVFTPAARSILYATITVWFPVFAYTCLWLSLLGIFPSRLLFLGTLWGLGEVLLAAVLAYGILRSGSSGPA